MNYFGKRSLSSAVSSLLHVSWYLLLIALIVAPLAAGAMIFFSTPDGETFLQKNSTVVCNDSVQNPSITCTEKSEHDWEKFRSTPLGLKLLMLPYLEAVIVLMLIMVRKSRQLFDNFKNEIVFNTSNVALLSTISKLNLGFGILTFSLNTMLLSVVLFLFCEIIKSGTVLQEEHDLTI